MKNPFTPSFGAPPPLLVGRRDLLDLWEDAIDEGPGSPGFATVYTGGRGVGKTVMLNAAEDIARAAGFAVISETASPGFLDRIVTISTPALLPPGRRRVRSASVAKLGGIELEPADEPESSLRTLVEQVTLQHPVLISLDELHRGVLGELREVAVVLQHAIREGRPLAFCAAGLPSALNELLKDQGVTFLRRADRHVLGTVDLNDVKTAFVDVVTENGRTIADDEARAAATATGGYPFLVQLVGYHSWRQNPNRKAISIDDVRAGAEGANRRIGRLVIEPALNDLSAVDRTFLVHMATDAGPSRMNDLAARMHVDANYASQYRLRLISAGLIQPVRRGEVEFALPQLREWIRDHVAFDPVQP